MCKDNTPPTVMHHSRHVIHDKLQQAWLWIDSSRLKIRTWEPKIIHYTHTHTLTYSIWSYALWWHTVNKSLLFGLITAKENKKIFSLNLLLWLVNPGLAVEACQLLSSCYPPAKKTICIVKTRWHTDFISVSDTVHKAIKTHNSSTSTFF